MILRTADGCTATCQWVRALAEHCIESELGIKTSMTIYREHLYELAGFKAILGRPLVERIVGGGEVPATEFPPLPLLSLRLAFEDPYAPLEGLSPTVEDCAEGRVGILLTSVDATTTVLLGLSFREERLEFDILRGLGVEDDGSLTGAKSELAVLEFQRRYMRNGTLELWADGSRIGRKDAYLPSNIDMRATDKAYEAMIAAARARVASRGWP